MKRTLGDQPSVWLTRSMKSAAVSLGVLTLAFSLRARGDIFLMSNEELEENLRDRESVEGGRAMKALKDHMVE